MHEVSISPRTSDSLEPVVGPEARRRLDDALADLRRVVGDRRMWHVNSTAAGGGVAEMLSTLLPYAAGAGVDVRWWVVAGDPEFFAVTKRLHNRLHDDLGDGGPLGPSERAAYRRCLDRQRTDLVAAVRPGDVVVLHDPQTAGLGPSLRDRGAHVVWRCHIGRDRAGPLASAAWDFLRPDLVAADAYVFSRAAYVWPGLPRARVAVQAPCIDVRSPKNRLLDPRCRDAVLHASGIVPGRPGSPAADGTAPCPVRHPAVVVEDAPTPADAPVVTQVSRWDRLKDPVGLVDAFARHGPVGEAHLVLVGPGVDGVADDPEGAAVWQDVIDARAGLAPHHRSAVHLVCVPMDDPDENALVVNAIQSRADVVVQKSLAEGFGLTVAEAMWKQRPVVASRVGGVQDQIVHRQSGVLVDDPRDHAAFGWAMEDLLAHPGEAHRMGEAARRRVCDHFLPQHHFAGEADVIRRVVTGRAA
jgi:trehalose synthase